MHYASPNKESESSSNTPCGLYVCVFGQLMFVVQHTLCAHKNEILAHTINRRPERRVIITDTLVEWSIPSFTDIVGSESSFKCVIMDVPERDKESGGLLLTYCCLPTPFTLVSGDESPIFSLVVLQSAFPSIWPAVSSLRCGLSTNPGVTTWWVCG